LESQYTAPSGAETDSINDPEALPQLYYTVSPEATGPVSFGLGMYSPYGLSMEWPEDSGFRTRAIEGRITYLSFNPVAAWQVHPTLSIAAGPTINYSKVELRQGLFDPTPHSDELDYDGDDVAPGFNLGLRWQPHPQHVFGLSYRSPTTLDYEGRSRVRGTGFIDGDSDAEAKLKYPQHIIFGWSYRPTPKWNLEFNVDWTDWERLNTVTLRQDSGPDFPIAFDWESSFFFEWGVTRYFDGGWNASAGYIFSENTVPETTFSPMVPDSDRHIFSLGGGRQYDWASWQLAYQLAYGPTRRVTDTPQSPAGESADGEYEFISHAVTFALGFRF
jgi:long-chain fatty acid transport protein